MTTEGEGEEFKRLDAEMCKIRAWEDQIEFGIFICAECKQTVCKCGIDTASIRKRFSSRSITTDRECYICKSKQTFVDKHGHARWHRLFLPDNNDLKFLCERCERREYERKRRKTPEERRQYLLNKRLYSLNKRERQLGILAAEKKLCECGCGERIPAFNSQCLPARFKKGHHIRQKR